MIHFLRMAYRPTERTRARAAAARERIVLAALDQLAEGGYASTSMVAVARRAGVATGSVYRHFPSKGDLFAEAFRRASQREVDVLVEIGHRSMPDRRSGSPPGSRRSCTARWPSRSAPTR